VAGETPDAVVIELAGHVQRHRAACLVLVGVGLEGLVERRRRGRHGEDRRSLAAEGARGPVGPAGGGRAIAADLDETPPGALAGDELQPGGEAPLVADEHGQRQRQVKVEGDLREVGFGLEALAQVGERRAQMLLHPRLQHARALAHGRPPVQREVVTAVGLDHRGPGDGEAVLVEAVECRADVATRHVAVKVRIRLTAADLAVALVEGLNARGRRSCYTRAISDPGSAVTKSGTRG
jgi:hypothetical protein